MIAKNMWVSCADDLSITPFELKPVKTADRFNAIMNKPYVMIEVCPHESKTCVSLGKGTNQHSFSCEYCSESGTDSHNWVGMSYSWSADYSTVVATHYCDECGESEYARALTDHWEEKHATCTTPGTMKYMADLEEEPGFESQYKTVEIPSRGGHEWEEAGRIEGQDICGGTAITYECKHCSATKTEGIANHDWNEEEWVTLFEPTCTEDGEYILCVEFLDGAFKRQEGEATTIPAYGHEWGEPIYAWSEDNSSVTADRYCKHNMIHVDTETVGATSKVTKEPMQETDGERVYTSDAFTNSAFAVRAKTVTIPAGEHVLTALRAALVANRPRVTLSVWYN